MKTILTEKELSQRAAKIRFFFTDVDGTLTDGCTYYSARGEEMKKFSHVDGTGFYLLKLADITAGLITGENSEIVQRRAEKLQLRHCFTGIKNKLECLSQFAIEHQCSLHEIAYIGDDQNDASLLKEVGLSFAPKNARKEIRKVVHCKGAVAGGQGAFREAVEFLLLAKNHSITDIFSQTL